MPYLLICTLAVAACTEKPARPPVRVAAASDLALAFEELRVGFQAQSPEQIEFVFGSTGQLARQLVEGAPYDLFAAANEAFTEGPIAAGSCLRESRAQYALGVLVVASPGNPITSFDQLEQPRFVRIALANPEHAPYGQAAKEALTRAGLWPSVERRLVYGQNIQQALGLVRSGNAEAALVARSLARDGLEVDPALYAPLKQTLVLCLKGKNQAGAKAFAAWVLGPEGRRVLAAAGFRLPTPPAR